MIEIINPAGLINLSKTVERVFFFNSTISHKSVSAKMIPNLQIHTYCNVILCVTGSSADVFHLSHSGLYYL